MNGILGKKENPRDVKFFSCTTIPKKNFIFFLFYYIFLFTKSVKEKIFTSVVPKMIFRRMHGKLYK